ncbi:MAG: mycothiol synthase [Mycobacteriales bacterium]
MAALDIERRSRLDADEIDRVSRLVEQVTEADGVRPLSEHVLLHLRYGGDAPARNLLGWRDTPAGRELVGYAHLDVTDPVEGASAELAVAPEARRSGFGQALVEALLADTADGRLRLWAHGEHPAAAALASSLGFHRERILWQLRRSLHAPLPPPDLPAGVTVRPFLVGQDEQGWTAVNNRAFAGHPDQGHWSIEDIRMREREPWFDPAGFFLAERGAELVGFHWTKVHGADEGHGHQPIGEVYVVGVDPAAQGQGLGRALTLVGLRYLRSRGLSSVLLYVDDTNTGAIKVYERLGFTRWDVDVSYRRT